MRYRARTGKVPVGIAKRIRRMAEEVGVPKAAKTIGVTPQTLVRSISGLDMNPSTVQAIVLYFRK